MNDPGRRVDPLDIMESCLVHEAGPGLGIRKLRVNLFLQYEGPVGELRRGAPPAQWFLQDVEGASKPRRDHLGLRVDHRSSWPTSSRWHRVSPGETARTEADIKSATAESLRSRGFTGPTFQLVVDAGVAPA